ncbi:MarR family winged helix-turn-helix transcriptional regulator [Leifsonia sp. NPDC080035]|uniref:MarR family winged helix-turn-helix transcriptional regulator n=1 Tax=Leifsonia sp. NPDC080035 TaxID=3143936 RepID=A0AAU7GG04_9MICO
MTEPGREDAIARVHRELTLVGRRGTARVRRENEALSVVDRSLLTFIDEHPGCRAVDIAAHLQLNRSTVSRQLGALFGHDLVEAAAVESGGRGLSLRLTAAGRAALDASARSLLTTMTHRLGDWSEDDIERFAEMLERYNAAEE